MIDDESEQIRKDIQEMIDEHDSIVINEYEFWKNRVAPKPIINSEYTFKVIDFNYYGNLDNKLLILLINHKDGTFGITWRIDEVNDIIKSINLIGEMGGCFTGRRNGKTNKEITQMLLDYGWIEDKNLDPEDYM